MGSSMLGQIDRKDVENRLLRFVRIDSVNPCTEGGAGESELAAVVEENLRGLASTRFANPSPEEAGTT